MSEFNIRSRDNHIHSQWDWAFLNACFGESGIKISDIDGMVERNGHCLYIETKARTDIIKTGQRRCHAVWAKIKEDSILCIWGAPGEPAFMQVWMPGEALPRPKVECNKQDIINFVSEWFARANKYRWHPGHSRPNRSERK